MATASRFPAYAFPTQPDLTSQNKESLPDRPLNGIRPRAYSNAAPGGGNKAQFASLSRAPAQGVPRYAPPLQPTPYPYGGPLQPHPTIPTQTLEQAYTTPVYPMPFPQQPAQFPRTRRTSFNGPAPSYAQPKRPGTANATTGERQAPASTLYGMRTTAHPNASQAALVQPPTQTHMKGSRLFLDDDAHLGDAMLFLGKEKAGR